MLPRSTKTSVCRQGDSPLEEVRNRGHTTMSLTTDLSSALEYSHQWANWWSTNPSIIASASILLISREPHRRHEAERYSPDHISSHKEPLISSHITTQDKLPGGRWHLCDNLEKLHLPWSRVSITNRYKVYPLYIYVMIGYEQDRS
jgi:hypothetical protein